MHIPMHKTPHNISLFIFIWVFKLKLFSNTTLPGADTTAYALEALYSCDTDIGSCL